MGTQKRSHIAIVGAGLAGLTAANILQRQHHVTVFEKSRGLGGRLATRYHQETTFDHGAPFFIAKDPGFKAMLHPMIDSGIIRVWHARFAEIHQKSVKQQRQWDDAFPHYVGVPRANAIGKAMADGLDVQLSTQITACNRASGCWYLKDASGKAYGHFDWVVFAMPPEQTASLAPDIFAHHAKVAKIKMKACYSLMLSLPDVTTTAWDVAHVKDMPITWLSWNHTKPGRLAHPALVILSSNAFADQHIDAEHDTVIKILREAASYVTGINLKPDHQALHRWRYANIPRQNGPLCYVDDNAKIAACGDWCHHGRVESAWKSAKDCSQAIMETL